jgi:hypothetical protein
MQMNKTEMKAEKEEKSKRTGKKQ